MNKIRTVVPFDGAAHGGGVLELMEARAPSHLQGEYGFPSELIAAHDSRELAECVAKGGEAWVLEERGIHGCAWITERVFDSAIYGLPMASVEHIVVRGGGEREESYRVLLKAVLSGARRRGVLHLSCQAPVGDAALHHALEDMRFRLMDTTSEYSWRPSDFDFAETAHCLSVRRGPADGRRDTSPLRLLRLGASVRTAEPRDLEELRALAGAAFTRDTLGRYAIDPALSLAATRRFYETWVTNACNGSFGDVVMVAELEGSARAFQVLRCEERLSRAVGRRVGAMGIGAIEPRLRNRGLFPLVLASVLAWSRRREMDLVRGRVLLDNVAMHVSCRALGGRPVASFHTFHWADDSLLDRAGVAQTRSSPHDGNEAR